MKRDSGVESVENRLGGSLKSKVKEDDEQNKATSRDTQAVCCSGYRCSAMCVCGKSRGQEQLVKGQVVHCQIICQIWKREKQEKTVSTHTMSNLKGEKKESLAFYIKCR